MNNRRINRPALACLAVLAASPLAAAADPGGWDGAFTPYLWAMGIDGDVQAGDRQVHSSASFSDIVDNLDFGGSAMLEASRGCWTNFVQLDYLKIDTGDVDTRVRGVDAELEFDSTILTAATGWRFTTSERSRIDVLAGVRYFAMDTQISIQTLGQRDADHDIYDAVLVLRPKFVISDHWYFNATMSAGAGDSDLTWELSPQVVYERETVEFRFGYRNLNYEFEEGDTELDINIHGPMLGVGMKF